MNSKGGILLNRNARTLGRADGSAGGIRLTRPSNKIEPAQDTPRFVRLITEAGSQFVAG